MNTKDLIERLESLSETLDYEVDSDSHNLKSIEDAISVLTSKDAEIERLRGVLLSYATDCEECGGHGILDVPTNSTATNWKSIKCNVCELARAALNPEPTS